MVSRVRNERTEREAVGKRTDGTADEATTPAILRELIPGLLYSQELSRPRDKAVLDHVRGCGSRPARQPLVSLTYIDTDTTVSDISHIVDWSLFDI